MSFESANVQDGCVVDFLTTAAVVSGQVVQLPDGRAGIVTCDQDAAKYVGVQVGGIVELAKTASIALLAGGDVYWDVSANAAHFRPESGTSDFYVGTVLKSVAGSATTVKVCLNKTTRHSIDLSRDDSEWTPTVAGSATATTVPGVRAKLSLVNSNEVEVAYVISQRSVLPTDKPIFECRTANHDRSSSAVQVNFGLASSGHASVFQSVTAFAAFNLIGGDNNIMTHSDDNTTDRAPADSTIDDADDTTTEYWIDFTDTADIKFYVNGVLVDTSSSKRTLAGALTTALYAILMIEKTSGTATGEQRCNRMRVRTGPQE